MIEEPPLLTIRRPTRRPTPDEIAAFRGVPTGFVVDALGGGCALDGRIGPIGGDTALWAAGPALTADCGPADILALEAALAFVQPGDVVVGASHGHQRCAAIGDRVCAMLRNAGAAGFVTDGRARDLAGIRQVGLPVWCAGLTPDTPFSKGPGRVGLPVDLGGRRVETGDMIVADCDGVVVVPLDRVSEVAARLDEIRRLEAELDASVAAGLTVRPHIRDLLASDRVKFI